MINFLIDNIFIEFGGWIFQQAVGIPIGTNSAPLLADLFLHSYEAEFIQELLRKGEKKLAQAFNYTFRYIDEVLSLSEWKWAKVALRPSNAKRLYMDEKSTEIGEMIQKDNRKEKGRTK